MAEQQAMPWEEYQPTSATGQGVIIPAAPDKPAAPPSGFQESGPGALTFVPGGPADPEVITAQAAARRGGEGKSATEIELASKEASSKKRAETIRAIMGRTADLFQKDIEGQPLERLGGLTEYFSALPTNERFNVAAQTMLPLIRPLVAQTAKEGDSDKEMQVFMAYIPQASDSDIAIKEKLSLLEMLIGGMVDGKVPSQVTQEVAQTQAQAQGNTFTYGGKTYTKGETVIPSPSEPTPPAGPSMMDTIGTGLGRGLGDVVQGAGDVLGIVGNPLNATINAATGANLSTDLGQTLRTATGLPDNPDTMASAINRGGVSALTGSLLARGGAGLATGAVRSGLEMLSSQPLQQTAGGMGAAAGQQIAASQGAGTVGQIAAALAGGATGAGLAGMARRAPVAVQPAMNAAEQAGIPVMTSDVMPPTTFAGKSLQQVGERIPVVGTGGLRVAQEEARKGAVGQLIRDFGADDVIPDAIAKNLAAKRKADLSKYLKLKDEAIGTVRGAGDVPVPQALQAIDDQIAKLAKNRTEASDEAVAKLQDLRGKIEGRDIDAIEAFRRDELGPAWQDANLSVGAADRVKSAVRAIYDPLRKDMGDFIGQTGGQKAKAKWGIANARLSEGMDELKRNSLKAALREAETTPEKVDTLLFSTKPSDIAALYRNLTPVGRAAAQAAIIRRAAVNSAPKAVDGVIDFDAISPAKFANEVGKLGKSVGVMFGADDMARVKGLIDAIRLTRRAADAATMTASGQQTWYSTMLSGLGGIGGGIGGGATGAAASAVAVPVSIGVGARVFESKAMRNLLLKMGRADGPEKAALAKRIMETAQAISKDDQ